MPPRYLRKPSPTHLQKCKEFRIEPCDTQTADGCCGVIGCKLCLEWETAEGIAYGSATFVTTSWVGSVGGVPFLAYWERATSVCEFIVVFQGEEVYRATCEQGASCRNPSGSVEATVGYDTGTLRWSVYEPRELELIDDPDTGCRTHFCGSCHCSCECLCVTVDEYGFGGITTGEICNVSYPCDAPVWEGSVGGYAISLALGRDQYGECIVTPTVEGVGLPSVAAPGCGSMVATILTPDGVTIGVRCKECTCEDGCVGCCLPIEADPAPYAVLMSNIPWEVVAPSCPSVHGVSGVFTPIDPTNPGIGSCGYCMTYCVYEDTLIVVPGTLKVPFDGITGCLDSPCSHGSLKLVLECNDAIEAGCCERLRLWVGMTLSGGTLVGDTGDVPPGECGGSATSWVKLSPSACTCDGGLSAEFALSGLSINCDEVFVGGPCDGQPKCCRLSCDLSDAKVVI